MALQKDRKWRRAMRLAEGANRRRKERADFGRSGVVPWSWGTNGRFDPREFWEHG